MTNRKLRRAIAAVLGTVSLAAISTQASATSGSIITAPTSLSGTNFTGLGPYIWDGGNIATVGNPASTGPMGPPPYSSDPLDSAGLGWNHNTNWKLFEITAAGGYTISVDRTGGTAGSKFQPAFSLFSSGDEPWGAVIDAMQSPPLGAGHSFNQVVGPDADVVSRWAAYNADPINNPMPAGAGVSSYAVDGGNTNDYMANFIPTPGTNVIEGFVGYANTGSWFTNGDGNFVKGAQDPQPYRLGTYDGSGNENVLGATATWAWNPSTNGSSPSASAGSIDAAYAGVGSSVNTSDGHADLQVWLPAGWYAMAIGGSCYDMSCSPTAKQPGNVNLKILSNPSVTAPVPVPAAVWLFGSALAGMGVIGRRKNKPAA